MNLSSPYTIHIEEIEIEVTRKKIRNIYLKVSSSDGTVRVSAPLNMSKTAINAFLTTKLTWIRRHKERILPRGRKRTLEYTDRERHFFRGKPVYLALFHTTGAQKAVLNHEILQLYTKKDADKNTRKHLVEQFYRDFLKKEIPVYISRYESVMGVAVSSFGVKKMKTRWGSCNHKARRIWINLDLARKSPECLEYLIVHEMVHILEPSHNARFKALMNRFYPDWKAVRAELKSTAIII